MWYSYHKSSLNHITYFIFWDKSPITLCSTVLKPTSLFADGIAWALVLVLLADKHFIANSDLMTKPLVAPSLTNFLTEQPTMMEYFQGTVCTSLCVWPRAPYTHLADRIALVTLQSNISSLGFSSKRPPCPNQPFWTSCLSQPAFASAPSTHSRLTNPQQSAALDKVT